MTTNPTSPKKKVFSSYQVLMIVILALLQFTIIVDFMVLSPLGAILMPQLHMQPNQFGAVVSGYAYSAFISGILAAGFADKFDRKKMLVFFYIGFIAGTLLCATAPNFHFLLIARIVTGLFGGVIGSISFAIITDIFAMEVRGRVMGFVQMALSASQVLGLPIGLFLANRLSWHAPFWMLVIFCSLVLIMIIRFMKPITGHLVVKHDVNPFRHLAKTVTNRQYLLAFGTTTLLATGGFMLMPFSSAFSTNNLGITLDQLTWIYLATGISALLIGPQIGKLSDKIGKLSVFIAGSTLTIITVVIYCNLGVTPLGIVMAISVVMFAGISARMIASSALFTAVPSMQDRGAFMSLNSSVQQLAGGTGAIIAGYIVVQTPSGKLQHYDTLGYVVVCTSLITIFMMYLLNKMVKRIMAARAQASQNAQAAQPAPVARPA
ncbi:MFS transporter [Pseudoflavitalea sp. G-6-1-2]|uniref:MFS transporter n=1 Tax=Pseudoflavitalea sp. G-6-1-2 TaxID=2728841 RepID=UPI00146AAAF5|nr:MFS transporter [Pseudoflavitalea sp. G-6-1-2]NML21878.1 MFS transporter [Pseudoflavitalea sp. G-6-1-2]